jgi:hypothetical protein
MSVNGTLGTVIINPANLDTGSATGNGGLALPIGSTGQRPVTPAAGTMRFNNNLNITEIYINNAWWPCSQPIGPVTTGAILNFDVGNPSCYPGSGTKITDLSGTGNNGTLYNGVSYSANNGGILSVNGTNSFIGVPNSASLNPGGSQWSVSMWFMPYAVNGGYGGPILYNKESIWEAAHGGNNIEIAWEPDWAWYGPSYVIYANQWYHTAHTYDGYTQRIYINSTLVWQQNVGSSIGTSGNDLGIGARGLSGGNGGGANSFGYFAFGSFIVYNRCISQSDVTQNFTAYRNRYGL